MDQVVTVFGGGGFLGRYVAQEVLKAGARLRVAERDPRDAWFVKPLGGLGQTQFIAADVTKPESVAKAVAGATSVINLVGILAGDFDKVHIEGAKNVAEAARTAGAAALVQISAIGADPLAESAYGRSKGLGEQAVQGAFPGATVIRPSIVFGPEDNFVNRFAGLISKLPVAPIIRPTVRFQPVWVGDLAQAIALAALDPKAHAGKTYELGGPEPISMAALNAWIAQAIGATPRFLSVPDPVARAMARFGGRLPGAPMTWDQWLMLQNDNVVAPGAAGFDAFGIAPRPLEAMAPAWLVRFRREGRFSLTTAA
ncbi:NADH dehydrogenase [Sphingomonas vulcanisoli]|uniref:NADH dehydrogenase n=1 Tax=Sphingomonas vulcanisoli TaxID=1658060 RepID=A0ABX0TVG1_9SPHN|nr:complex I NDUFA9 subunit family protein [Sphingomonas vulcanisoli]NIJ09526.1 NADH dehydrogenase [Sphingomonas vulcanisoli]